MKCVKFALDILSLSDNKEFFFPITLGRQIYKGLENFKISNSWGWGNRKINKRGSLIWHPRVCCYYVLTHLTYSMDLMDDFYIVI